MPVGHILECLCHEGPLVNHQAKESAHLKGIVNRLHLLHHPVINRDNIVPSQAIVDQGSKHEVVVVDEVGS